jgi:cardiolipin synthase A/B
MNPEHYTVFAAVTLALIYVLAIPSALEAILKARTAQGAIAWAISLITLSPVSVPLYLVFGRGRFDGYLAERNAVEAQTRRLVQQQTTSIARHVVTATPDTPLYTSLFRLARMPATRGNKVNLLIDGKATFDSIAEGLQRAEKHILFQFYIIRDDALGRRICGILASKALAGVPVFLLYDNIGSAAFSSSNLYKQLDSAGVCIAPFSPTWGHRNRFQLNFRNHRKVVVVDGNEAWIGGHNVGDDYLGLDKRMGPWRDTHAHFTGPAVLGAEFAFATDWHWATREDLPISWEIDPKPQGESQVLVFPSDPASEYEEAGLMFHQIIVAARRRIWIASPYFVPDNAIMSALQLAALRGVDVRIIIPEKIDSAVVGMANWSYTRQLLPLGIKVYRYQAGFMHQKVFLMDDQIAAVGTANFDNRSFRLNFEVTLLVDDSGFAKEVEDMLKEDMNHCRRVYEEEFANKPAWFFLAMGAARLLAPVL